MAKAVWNGTVIAESDNFEKVEGNVYFPPESIKKEFFSPSSTTTVCSWKGTASYYDINVDGETNAQAAWSYESPKDAAKNITGHVAFWKGVEISE